LGRLTTHVLDTALGKPAAGLSISLRRAGKHGSALASVVTNKDGRADQPLLEGDTMEVGSYELVFEAGAYFDRIGLSLPSPKFLDQVVIRFGIGDPTAHYHVPLLLSPYGYSTYRGS
jgi:5-hydroxyisourate hydrolase